MNIWTNLFKVNTYILENHSALQKTSYYIYTESQESGLFFAEEISEQQGSH